MNQACVHHIAFKDACPWCKREATREFKVNSPFLKYQVVVNDFVQSIEPKEDIYGPQGHLILMQDLSGTVLCRLEGSKTSLETFKNMLPTLENYLDERIARCSDSETT